jgi:ParB family transcriptional regulator, chromosome partitioning protein
MTDHPSRLGRGLGALLTPRPSGDLPVGGTPRNDASSEGTQLAGTEYREVPIDALRPNPRQPRTAFDEDALAELAASIALVGLLQPIVVREVGVEQYEIVMGERRWRAAAAADLAVVPVLVRQTAPDAMLRDALLENLHRADLNPLDEAAAYAQLLEDFGATHEQLATRLGRSRAHVTNTLRLLQLPPAVQRRMAAGVLSAGHARAILALSDADAQEELAGRVVAEGLSVRAVEEIVAVGSEHQPRRRERQARLAPPEFAEIAEALTERWETRVMVQAGQRKGRLVVEFASVGDLDRILAIVAPDVHSVQLGIPPPPPAV